MPRPSRTVEHWESCDWFWSLWLSPDLASKYTAASRNSTLSSREARHGKFRRNKKEGEKKEAGKIYVLIHICGHGHFLNAFNTLTVKRKAHRGNFKSESERIKVHCNSRLVCDFIQTIKRLCICCNTMTGFITRHFKMSFCMNFDLSLNVLFQNQPYFLQKISTNQAMKTKHYFSFRKDLYICLFVNVFQRAGWLVTRKSADLAIVSMTHSRCSDISPDTRGIITPCLANSVCYCCSTL